MSEERSDDEILWERAMRAHRRRSTAQLVGVAVAGAAVLFVFYVLSHLGGMYRF